MESVTAGRLPCPVHASAVARPDAAALIAPERTLSYGGLDRFVEATAARLRAVGQAPGARVALRLPRDWRYPVLLWALMRAGRVACPLSTRLPPRGLAERVGRVGWDMLVTEDPDPGSLPDTRVLVPGELLGTAPGAPPSPAPIPLERDATIVFTSGSTGEPKGALHTFGNHYYNAAGSNRNITLAPGDRWLLSLPLYHVGGLAILFRCALAGAAVVLPERDVPLGEAIRRHHVTHASLVSTQLRRLLAEDWRAAEGLQAILLGGGAIPPSLIDDALGRELPIHTSYGLTEMASQVTATRPGAGMEQLRTSGTPLPHRELRVADDGEILVRGNTLFRGYVEGDRVLRPLDDGWFRTGDLGALDADGRLHVRGRTDNMFVSGGENIQPEEIERALCRIEGVERAVVVPVPDEEYGARPVAFVRVGEGGPQLEQLPRRLEGVLSRFKIPDAIRAWPQGSGDGRMKVDRGWLRRRAAEVRER